MDNEVAHVFVYGMMRPDDTSDFYFNEIFNSGMTARKGHISPAMLFEEGGYPFVVLEDDEKPTIPFVIGYAVGTSDKSLFARKLRLMDFINGYNLTDNANNLCERSIVPVILKEEVVPAYIYHRPNCNKEHRIQSGDWLKKNTWHTIITNLLKFVH